MAVPLSDRSAPAATEYVLADAEARFVLHGGPDLPAGIPPGTTVLTESDAEGHPSVPDLPDGLGGPGDLAQILYTSGTTGTPKAVGARHANLAHGCTLDERRLPLRHSSAFLHAFPVGTNAGQTMLVNALNAHATCVTAPQFTPARFLRLLSEHDAGSVFLVPAMAIELLASPALADATASGALDSVRLVGSTAAALPQPVALGLGLAFPKAQIVNYYTSTEAAPAQITLLFDPARPTSPGRPASLADLRVTTPEGLPVPAGRPGELWLRSPAAPRAYMGRRTARSSRGAGYAWATSAASTRTASSTCSTGSATSSSRVPTRSPPSRSRTPCTPIRRCATPPPWEFRIPCSAASSPQWSCPTPV